MPQLFWCYVVLVIVRLTTVASSLRTSSLNAIQIFIQTTVIPEIYPTIITTLILNFVSQDVGREN